MEPLSSPAPRRAPIPNNRDCALDLLRTVALGRVLLWHAFAAPWMTFFAAMPVMFFVAGTLIEEPADQAAHRALLRRRARRLLLPLWVYAAVVAAAGLLREPPGWHSLTTAPTALLHATTWIVPLLDPAGADWHGGWLSTHLWYVRAYLWVLVLLPVLAAVARRAGRALPLLAGAVVLIDLSHRAHVPLVGSGSAAVLIGDAVVFGGFAVLGMAYRRRSAKLPARRLAVGAATAGAATIAYVALAGLPAGGVNDSYGAVTLTGVAWLLAAGAAEAPIRLLAERRWVRSLSRAVTGRAVTVYLWHPPAIVVAYAVLKGSDRFPKMRVVQHWPVPAVAVVALTVASTAVAVAALGWVEDLAARRSPSARGRQRRRTPRVGARAARLAAVVAPGATALALVMPTLVVPVADGDPAGAASVFGAPRPPSFRAALSNDAFATRRAGPATPAVPLAGVDPAGAHLGRALDSWLAGRLGVDAVAVGVAVQGKVWTGAANEADAAPPLTADEEFGALSLTKTFTAALVLREVAAGRVDLDAPVPPIAGLSRDGDATRITVRQLLEHTSGLVDYSAAPGFDGARPLSALEAVRLALAAGLQSPPGAEVHYSNTNFQYLGLLLEQVAGRPYADLLDHLLRAQRLRHTRLGPGGPGWPGFASGGVVSTVSDLARWGDALFTPGKVLPARDVTRLTTLNDKNMALSMWPFCPCGTGPDGEKQYAAVGQHVGFGGLVRFPSGMTLVVRFGPTTESLEELVVDLGHALEAALQEASAAFGASSPRFGLSHYWSREERAQPSRTPSRDRRPSQHGGQFRGGLQ
jgi:CubicO group peptidase (beta-lactamase class C family)/peptidoglycan/LPS O-acetylase OafA/YrhL